MKSFERIGHNEAIVSPKEAQLPVANPNRTHDDHDAPEYASIPNDLPYIVDTRPMCQGLPFILTDSAHPRHVLKHGNHFLVLDQSGTIPLCNTLGYGYYRHDTRHLSHWEISINDMPLSLLSSNFSKGYAAELLYTNTHTEVVSQQKLTMHRHVVLTDHVWERIVFENYDSKPVDVEVKMVFQSDFADMFEVRGLNRPNRGDRMVPITDASGASMFLAYRGQDGVLLETIIEFVTLRPIDIQDGVATFKLTLPVRCTQSIEIRMSTRMGGHTISAGEKHTSFAAAADAADAEYLRWRHSQSGVITQNEIFDVALELCFRDLFILRQPTPKGYGLSAGIPWYSALFGRDTAITALQMMPFNLDIAKTGIDVLAAYQGKEDNDFTAEMPGRILHELRLGELARVKEIPHSPYYGTVDATQLWLMLIGEYIRWTADLESLTNWWPNIKLALSYLDRASPNGYITYEREGPDGLENQGWKDSHDSMTYSDGTLAKAPIAVCEAQGYLYAAWVESAQVAQLLGHHKEADVLLAKAADLKARFQKDFWMESENFIALALDGDGKHVGAITSNPGHCLWTGILDQDKADLVASRLMAPDLNSGWGVRTLSSGAVAFNPMSYHNGSIWPHDNAIIMDGLRKTGRIDDAHGLMKKMFEVMQQQAEFRLPELFCGFPRTASTRPVDYPVSCIPQAWAVGTMFQMLKACINFQPDAMRKVLRIVNPVLPEWLSDIKILGLRVGNATIDLALHCDGQSTYCRVLRKQGDVRVIIEN